MSNQDFVHHKELNINNVRVSPQARQSKTSPAKRVYVNYGRKKLVFQTPKMKIPMGVSEYDPSKAGGAADPNAKIKRYFEPQLNDHPELTQFFHDFEMLVFRAAGDNCQKWLNKAKIPTDPDLMDNVMTLVVRKNVSKKDGTVYPDTVRFKLMEKWEDGKPTTDYDVKVYDKNGNRIELEDIGKGGEARFIVSCSGLTIVGGRVHPSWKVEQVRFYPGSTTVNLQENAFLDSSSDDDDDDDENKESAPASENSDPEEQALQEGINELASSDDDDEEESSGEEESSDDEPEPPKKSGRGRPRKK